jgi:hypothetical protein
LAAALSKPFRRGYRGCGIFVHQNHAAGGEDSSIMVGIFVCLCLASQKPSEQEFFVPARTDLGVKLLTLSRRQLKNKISKIMRKWRFRNYLPSYNTSPKTHLSSSRGHKNTHTRVFD